MRRRLVVGNWKMNGNRASNSELLAGLKAAGGDIAKRDAERAIRRHLAR